MEFKVYTPSHHLKPYIHCFLEGDGRKDAVITQNTLFPNGFPGIFFNFGTRGRMSLKTELESPPVSIFGQIDRYFTVQHWPGFYSLGVLLKPSVVSQLFRINMGEFTNNAYDGRLIHKDLHFLHEQLESCGTTAEKIRLIEQHITSLITTTPSGLTVVDHALHLLQQPVCQPIQKLATCLNVSDRNLETKFRAAVGIAPKTYSLILRFKRIEFQLRRLSTVRWQDLTFAGEYFDQNHFIKDFKRFTGHTPSAYLLTSFDMGRKYLGA